MEDEIRNYAFRWLREQIQIYGEVLPRSILEQGLQYQGQRITLIGPSGIWKPKAFETIPISITSTYQGPYDDQFSEDGLLIYKYRGADPNHRDNVGLREAMRTRTPLIYFHGLMKGRYLPVWPVSITENHPGQLYCTVAIDPAYAFGLPDTEFARLGVGTAESSLSVRRYVMSYTKHRLHQSAFREQVLSAYNGSCTLCSLKHLELLDAANIIPDSQAGGERIVPNGLSLCKIHHAAFDANIIGITPDYLVSIRQDILEEHDGPMLRYGLQQLDKQNILLPRRKEFWPDQERLEIRFARFQEAG